MKKIILFLFILCFVCSTSMAWWPWSKKQSVEQIPQPQAEVQKDPATISNARQLIKELNTELQNTKNQNNKLKENLINANKKIESGRLEIEKIQKIADALKEWGVTQQTEKFYWMEKYNKSIARYHQLKAIAATLAAVAGIFLGLRFMVLIPPPYNLALPVGLAGLLASLVWFVL